MLQTINEFVSKYGLENFVVVADSGLMNNANIAELEAHGYKYIIGAKINIQTTVQRMMPITGRREYAGWKRLTSIQIRLPLNKDVYTQTILMARHQKIAKLFDEDFWVTQ